MDMEALRERAYTYDPRSLESLVDVSRELSHDFRHDHHPYEGGSMSQAAHERGREISVEYGLKALDIVNDLAQAPAPTAPSGLPSAEIAASFLRGESHGLVMPYRLAEERLVAGPYGMRHWEATHLLDWMIAGGYLLELGLVESTGQVCQVKCGRKTAPWEAKLSAEPRWIASSLTVGTREPLSPLVGVAAVYAHPAVVEGVFAK